MPILSKFSICTTSSADGYHYVEDKKNIRAFYRVLLSCSDMRMAQVSFELRSEPSHLQIVQEKGAVVGLTEVSYLHHEVTVRVLRGCCNSQQH
jgi:hypothetical protein